MNVKVFDYGVLKGMVDISQEDFIYSLSDYRIPKSLEGFQCNFEEGTDEYLKLLADCREIVRNIRVAKRLSGD